MARILVVEDEPTVRDLMLTVLEEEGHSCVGCSTSLQALDRAEGSQWDVLVADLHVPGLDAIGLHRELAQRGSPLAKRMIVVTGSVTEDDVDHFARAFGIPTLTKPFALDTLRNTVTRVLTLMGPEDRRPSPQPAAPARRRP